MPQNWRVLLANLVLERPTCWLARAGVVRLCHLTCIVSHVIAASIVVARLVIVRGSIRLTDPVLRQLLLLLLGVLHRVVETDRGNVLRLI